MISFFHVHLYVLPPEAASASVFNRKGQSTSKQPRAEDSEKRARLNVPSEHPVGQLCLEWPFLWCIDLSVPTAVSCSGQPGGSDLCLCAGEQIEREEELRDLPSTLCRIETSVKGSGRRAICLGPIITASFPVCSRPTLWALCQGSQWLWGRAQGLGFSPLALLPLGTGQFCVAGIRLCVVDCVAASLVSTYYMPVASMPQVGTSKKCLQPLPDVPLGTKSPPVENHWSGGCGFWATWAGWLLTAAHGPVPCSDEFLCTLCWKVLKNDQESGSPRLVVTSVVINFPNQPSQMSHFYLNPSAMVDWFCSPVVSSFL